MCLVFSAAYLDKKSPGVGTPKTLLAKRFATKNGQSCKSSEIFAPCACFGPQPPSLLSFVSLLIIKTDVVKTFLKNSGGGDCLLTFSGVSGPRMYHSFQNHYILNLKTITSCNWIAPNFWKYLRQSASCNCVLVRRTEKTVTFPCKTVTKTKSSQHKFLFLLRVMIVKRMVGGSTVTLTSGKVPAPHPNIHPSHVRATSEPHVSHIRATLGDSRPIRATSRTWRKIGKIALNRLVLIGFKNTIQTDRNPEVIITNSNRSLTYIREALQGTIVPCMWGGGRVWGSEIPFREESQRVCFALPSTPVCRSWSTLSFACREDKQPLPIDGSVSGECWYWPGINLSCPVWREKIKNIQKIARNPGIQGSVNGAFQTVVRVLWGNDIRKAPSSPQLNLLLTSCLTSCQPLFDLLFASM